MNDHLGIQISVHYVLTKDKNLSATEREIKKKKFAKQPKQRDTSESYRSNNDGDLQIDWYQFHLLKNWIWGIF